MIKYPLVLCTRVNILFIKKEYMLKFYNGELKRNKFLDKKSVSKMRITPREAKILIQPWVEAELRK